MLGDDQLIREIAKPSIARIDGCTGSFISSVINGLRSISVKNDSLAGGNCGIRFREVAVQALSGRIPSRFPPLFDPVGRLIERAGRGLLVKCDYGVCIRRPILADKSAPLSDVAFRFKNKKPMIAKSSSGTMLTKFDQAGHKLRNLVVL